MNSEPSAQIDKSEIAVVADLSHDGRGVVKPGNKVMFVAGALPGETVRVLPMKKYRGQLTGKLLEVIEPSPHRVEPRCEYFGVCGGCTLQHLDSAEQLALKQKVLFDNLQRIGGVEPADRIAPLTGDVWNYRRKARPGVKLVPKKGGILVGFREQGSRYLTSLRTCYTLDRSLAGLLDPLHELVTGLSCSNQVPQIEMAVGDRSTALIMRHLQPFTALDLQALRDFAEVHEIQLFLQSGGPDTVTALCPEQPEPLTFNLPAYDLEMMFTPLDFVQVNGAVNRLMIDQALHWLQANPADHILDLFCGLGNFTLPIARSGARVVGIEGEPGLVARARRNADHNGLNNNNVEFLTMDLHKDDVTRISDRPFSKMLLDPPRSGALQIVTDLVPQLLPSKIVYVSCNPSTLARDAAVLVKQHGYQFEAAGAIDMFPHTAHVESMAVFSR